MFLKNLYLEYFSEKKFLYTDTQKLLTFREQETQPFGLIQLSPRADIIYGNISSWLDECPGALAL